MIFTVTTFNKKCDIESCHCMGYFNDEDVAVKAVIDNWSDISEDNTNMYCVIEQFDEGLYPICKKEIWFKLNDDGKYLFCERPIQLLQIINFGIG